MFLGEPLFFLTLFFTSSSEACPEFCDFTLNKLEDPSLVFPSQKSISRTQNDAVSFQDFRIAAVIVLPLVIGRRISTLYFFPSSSFSPVYVKSLHCEIQIFLTRLFFDHKFKNIKLIRLKNFSSTHAHGITFKINV